MTDDSDATDYSFHEYMKYKIRAVNKTEKKSLFRMIHFL